PVLDSVATALSSPEGLGLLAKPIRRPEPVGVSSPSSFKTDPLFKDPNLKLPSSPPHTGRKISITSDDANPQLMSFMTQPSRQIGRSSSFSSELGFQPIIDISNENQIPTIGFLSMADVINEERLTALTGNGR